MYSTLEQMTYHVPSETMLNVAMAQCPAIIRPEIYVVSGFSHEAGKIEQTSRQSSNDTYPNTTSNPTQQAIPGTWNFRYMFRTLGRRQLG